MINTMKSSIHSNSPSSKAQATGRWNPDEHRRFVEALKLYGKNWKKVEEHVRTRDGTQVRSHAQKYFAKIEKAKKDKKTEDRFECASSMRNASGTSISTQHTQKDNHLETELLDDQLKANLPMSEGSNLIKLARLKFNSLVSRSSNNSATKDSVQGFIPASHDSKALESTKKEVDITPFNVTPTQLPLFTAPMIPYIQQISHGINFLPQTALIHPNIPFLGLLPPTYCVYMNLRKYLLDSGRLNKSLKLSDFVDLGAKATQSQDELYDMSNGKKKVKLE